MGMPILPSFPILAFKNHPRPVEIPQDACAELDAVGFQKANHTHELLPPFFSHRVLFEGVTEIASNPLGFTRPDVRCLALHFFQEGRGIFDIVAGLGVRQGPHPKDHQDQAQAFDHAPKVDSACLAEGLVTPKVSHNACTPSRHAHPRQAPPSLRRAPKPPVQVRRPQRIR